MNKYSEDDNDKDAIIRTIKSFHNHLSDEDWDIYLKTLVDENEIYISISKKNKLLFVLKMIIFKNIFTSN